MIELVDSKDRTVGRSFRIKEQWLDILKKEAEREGLSVNALMNKILEDFSMYHRHFTRMEAISFTKHTTSLLLEKISSSSKN